MRAMGLDYGEKRIGLAISDDLGMIAKPMPILKVKSLADGIGKIQRIAKSQKITKIIIGLPLNSKREETQQSIQVRYFAHSLRSTNGLEIEFWNESFSTKQARSKATTKRQKAHIDSEAARIILQEYLDHQSEKKKPGMILPQENIEVI